MTKQRIPLLLAATLVGITAAYAVFSEDNPVVKQKTGESNQTEQKDYIRNMQVAVQPLALQKKQTRRTGTDGITADFSVVGEDAQDTTWIENFDNGASNWTFTQGEDDAVTWSTKQKTGKNPFTDIDPTDQASLFVEGPYQMYKRTIATATSKEIDIPANGRLTGYVLTSPNLNDYASLVVSVSSNDFADSTVVFNTLDIKEGTSQWAKIDADLAAYAGKKAKVRIQYGPGKDDSMGGYLNDYYIDNLMVSGVASIDGITVVTGDEAAFVDRTQPEATAWEWHFAGGTPETSTEQNPTVCYTQPGTYDVTLTATVGDETATVTKTGFVTVKGQAPTAGVQWPSEFRELTTRMRMVAPLLPITYKDNSVGYPTSYSWTFYTPADLAKSSFFVPDTVYSTKDVDYAHNALNQCYVTHIVQNDSGYAYVDDSVQVQYSGTITNMLKDDYLTNFTDGDLTFPGANKMGITAWAEKISKPSRPMVMDAIYVKFTKASAENIADQIAPVSFSLYSSKDGLPDKSLALLDTWTVSELNYAIDNNQGLVELELSQKYILNDECFIVIDGIPEKNDSLECAFAMTTMRNHDNTAYMLNKGQWRPFTGYFQAAPGGQASLAVFPHISYSVISTVAPNEDSVLVAGTDSILVGKDADVAKQPFFSYLGYKYAGSDADWCRVEGTPNGYTLDTLQIAYDALPEGIDERTAVLTLTDDVDTFLLRVVQRIDGPTTAISGIRPTEGKVSVYDLTGRRIGTFSSKDQLLLPRGIYIVDGKKILMK